MLCAACGVGDAPRMKAGSPLPGIGRYLTLGIQMVVVTAAIAGIGYWLDRKTGHDILFLVVFFFIGAAGGIAVAWRAISDKHE